jgi:hypothetical protein
MLSTVSLAYFLLGPIVPLRPDNAQPMIALFLPTGNHDAQKTLTLTNRYTNIYFCT